MLHTILNTKSHLVLRERILQGVATDFDFMSTVLDYFIFVIYSQVSRRGIVGIACGQ